MGLTRVNHFTQKYLRQKISQLSFLVGSQLSTFSDLRKKFRDMVVNNLMHVPIDQMMSKPEIIGFPDLRFGVGEL